jgi:chitin synthase
MKNVQVRMAWREKLALCMLIFLQCAILIFMIVGFGKMLCPRQPVISPFELSTTLEKPSAYAYGRAYDLKEILKSHDEAYGIDGFNFAPFLGNDVSQLFYKNSLFSTYCEGLPEPQADWDNLALRHKADQTYFAHRSNDPVSGQQKRYIEYMNRYAYKRIVWYI